MKTTPFVWRGIAAVLAVLALGALRYRTLATTSSDRSDRPRETLTVGFLPVT